MSNIGNKYKVGVLAIVAFVIFIFALVILGTLKYFKTTYDFMTAVSASVQGLEEGAKVKVKGVTIGSVDKIQLGPEMKVIYVYMKFDPSAFLRVATIDQKKFGNASHVTKEHFAQGISERVAEGLRCRLDYGDITGTLFVDITFFDPKENPPGDFSLPPNHPPYIPAVPTALIGSLISDVQKASQSLAKVDMLKISLDIQKLLEKTDRIVDEKEVKEILAKVSSVSSNLDKLVVRVNDAIDRKQIEEITQSMQKSFDNFNSMFNSIEKFSEEARIELKSAKLAETSEKARDLMDVSGSSLKDIDSLKHDFKRNLDEMYRTLESAKTLLDSLERNPNSVIYGKPNRPIVEPQ
jgi:ABC-type transporter Mla subunit MlaD